LVDTQVCGKVPRKSRSVELTLEANACESSWEGSFRIWTPGYRNQQQAKTRVREYILTTQPRAVVFLAGSVSVIEGGCNPVTLIVAQGEYVPNEPVVRQSPR